MTEPDLILIGASARAAAFSAARAGYFPYWIDQFGDRDLGDAFPGRRIPPGHYPDAIAGLIDDAPDAPWIYTGALENHPRVLQRIAQARPLLGNGRDVCERVRDPWLLQSCLRGAGIPYPDILPCRGESAPGAGWIAKPFRSGGGLGIRPFGGPEFPGSGFYLQRWVQGENVSAVYVANGKEAALLGVTQQLVGRAQFHAGPYSYCGSIGPLRIAADERGRWRAIGAALAAEFGLQGIFGVDAVCTDGAIVPLEVNPRYTASVEVIERALDIPAIKLHVNSCAGDLAAGPWPDPGAWIGKAYLFAPRRLEIRDTAPLLELNGAEGDLQLVDIPASGAIIPAGAPIMTILIAAEGPEACADLLTLHARRIYEKLKVESEK